ncbi:MAG: hypothetical protein H0T15_05120, partial [Thermoleophilaceae bacterium]|nr:hypothetical protein [Thermoleophilaceae bacterium]
MGLHEKIEDLVVEVEGYELEPLEQRFSPEFTRHCTVIRIKGAGTDGVGEDVIYEGLDHIALQAAGPVLPLSGTRPLGELLELIRSTDLFPDSPPVREDSRN